jgi:hypothetical protein
MIQAAKLGDSATIETLIAKGADVNAETGAGTTSLMMAASAGQLAVLRALLQRGAVVNKVRSDGFSALTLAVFFGHEQIVRELLASGAEIDAGTPGKKTAEMWAVARGFPGIASLLQERRRQIDLPTDAKMTDPHEAAKPSSQTSPAPPQGPEKADVRSFDEGIRKVGQAKSIKTGTAELKPLKQTAELDESFEKRARPVAETKPPQTPTVETKPQHKPLDNDEFFDEGIRKVGETKWTKTAAPELKPQSDSLDGDEFFEEGIRKVGEANWRTAASTDAQLQTADADEFFECIRNWSDEVEDAPATSSQQKIASITSISDRLNKATDAHRGTKAPEPVEHESAAAGVLWSEGIRRVGQTNWNAKDPGDLVEQYPKVATGSFSAFSALADRLGLKWKHVGIAAVVVLALAAFNSLTILRQTGDQPQPTTESAAAVTTQAPPTESQSSVNETPQAVDPVPAAVAPESSVPAAAPAQIGEPAATAATVAAPRNETAEAVTTKPEKTVEKQTVGKPDIGKVLDLRKTQAATRSKPAVSTTNPRQRTAARAGKREERVGETAAPAAITVVPSAPQRRVVETPSVNRSQPTTVIEGSSTKKKVIQWP